MKFDRQDAFLVIGVASLVAGVAMWSRPAALILFGLLCLFDVLLIERGNVAHGHRLQVERRKVEKRQAS